MARTLKRNVSPARSGRKTGACKATHLFFDALEARQLLAVPGAIIPGHLYQEVAFYDSSGDTVEIKMEGPTSGSRGFTLRLAGDATNHADILTLNMLNMVADNGLNIVVTPNELIINAGPDYNKMYSAGYTSITTISASHGMTALGSIRLSAVIVNSISLPGIDVGDIILDTGMVTYVDRVNTTTLSSINISAPAITITSPVTGEAEIFDESPVGPNGQYNPTAGLIDLWNVKAKSINAIIINGSISADTLDPFDETNVTNDLRGVIDVTGNIGSIIAPRSAMRNAIRAGGIGSIELGRIDGEITTRDPFEPTTVYLPRQFSGFLSTAGHLNLGFTASTAELMTGNIRAGGGISGSDPSETDPLLVPDKYAAAVVNTSVTKGIASIEFNGSVLSRWISASSIGNITALVFEAGASFEAGTNIGNVEMLMTSVASASATPGAPERKPVELEGMFKAGGNIGNINSATSLKAEVIASGNIGNIKGVAGGINSTVVLAGGNIGNITVFQKVASATQISAGGDIGDIRVYSGSVGWRVKARNIGNLLVDSGSMNLAVFVAAVDLGSVTVTSPEGTAIEGGSLIAGHNIGDVSAFAFAGTAIHGTLIQAGNRIASVSGISYGALILPEVSAGVTTSVADVNNGLDAPQILAAEIGPILGQAYVGTGIHFVVIHAQVGDIASITGIGNGNGIYKAIVVAEGGIGPIVGRSTVLGAGIFEGGFDANGASAAANGTIGQITAQGGPAGGDGILLTRFQASNRIAGISGTANANGGNALHKITTNATSYGEIKALVLGGQTGNGIFESSFKAWTDYENNRPDIQMDSVDVDVRSALGVGISGSFFQVKGDLVSIRSKAFAAAAILGSSFEISQGNFGRIYAESINSGSAIENSEFIASNGSITSARDLASVATSGITAIASGTSPLSHAISNTKFRADANIGMIKAVTKGGTAILNSRFIADSDYGNAKNGPNLPDVEWDGEDFGAIFGIYAKTAGANRLNSAGISGSTFEGELISSITVEVTDREEGGPGISNSVFSARNAFYDGLGNFNNEGRIGTITVTDGSLRGNGIEFSQFHSGAAGSIGNINVTVLGGAGISNSEFRASLFDYDQSRFSGTIGNIRVNVGRAGGSLLPLPPPPNDAWTLLPAGIDSSYFAAYGGIGNVDVNSIGTGVFFSAFLASFDALNTFGSIPGFILPLLAENVPGNLGNITITATGRFAFGSALSLYAGESVGDINIRVSSRDTNQATLTLPNMNNSLVGQALQQAAGFLAFNFGSLIGPAASVASAYIAMNGDIGSISVANAGAGYGSVLSAYVALPFGFYGPVSLSGTSFLNLFWGIARASVGTLGPTTTTTSIESSVASVSSLVVSQSVRANFSVNATQVLDFKVNFSNTVDVVGRPWFAVYVGGALHRAQYESGSGTSQLVFRVLIEPGDSGQVTILPGTRIQVDLRNRIVESSAGFELTQLVPAIIDLGDVQVDTQTPVITSISSLRTPSRRTAFGQVVRVLVAFSEPVLVRGLPTILLTFGKALTRSLVYSGGSGTNTLEFSYKLTRADIATKKKPIVGGQIILPLGAAIFDHAGNTARLPDVTPSVASNAASTTPASPKKKRATVRAKAPLPKGPMTMAKSPATAVKVL